MPKVFLNYYHNLEKYIQELYESVLGGEGLFSEFRALIIGALIPAICEESLFRGLFQRSLEEVMKPIKAIIIVSIIFGIIHMNPISIIPLIFVGMYLGNLAYSSKTLLLPIIIHFLHNGFAVATIYVTPLNYLNNPFTYLTLPIAIPLCIVSFAATAAISYYIYKITKVNRIENRIENYNIPL
ncbi:MAG: CPBP family intramembrane glutamic endopeptidase [FCB group bacterium]